MLLLQLHQSYKIILCALPVASVAANAGAQGDDRAYVEVQGKQHDGYLPHDLGIGGGGVLDIVVYLNCGQLQGKWPLSVSNIEHN